MKEEEEKDFLRSPDAIKRQLERDDGMFCLVLQVSSCGITAKRQRIAMQADGGSSGVSADAFQRTMQLVNVLAHSQLFSCLDILTYLPAFPSSHLHLLPCPSSHLHLLLALTCICCLEGKRTPGSRRRRRGGGGRNESPQNARKERRTLDVDRRDGVEISNQREYLTFANEFCERMDEDKTANHMSPLFCLKCFLSMSACAMPWCIYVISLQMRV